MRLSDLLPFVHRSRLADAIEMSEARRLRIGDLESKLGLAANERRSLEADLGKARDEVERLRAKVVKAEADTAMWKTKADRLTDHAESNRLERQRLAKMVDDATAILSGRVGIAANTADMSRPMGLKAK